MAWCFLQDFLLLLQNIVALPPPVRYRFKIQWGDVKRGLCWKGSFKRAWKEKNGNWELVVPICSAVTKTGYRDQNTNSLIVTIENYSFKCALLWQYSTGKANSSKFPSRWSCFIFLFVLFKNIGELASHHYHCPLALVVNKSPAVYIYFHPRSTDFEEELEGLWTGYKFPGSHLLFSLKSINKA